MFESRETILFPLVSVAVFMIFLSFGTSHVTLTVLLVVLLLSLNYRETQAPKRRKRLEEQARIIKTKADNEWMISALEFFEENPPQKLRVSYTTDNERSAQLKPIRTQILAVARGIIVNFPHTEIQEKCNSKSEEDTGTMGWDRTFSAYLFCALQNIWALKQPEWIYSGLLQQYGTAPLMLCMLAVRAYFSKDSLKLNLIPSPNDILQFNREQKQIRMIMDYNRVFVGTTREFLAMYSDGASTDRIDNLIQRLKNKEAFTVEELRWILTAEYAARFRNTSADIWEITKPIGTRA